jgi:hypothetical protein
MLEQVVNWRSSFNTVTRLRLDNWGKIPVGGADFTLHQPFQTESKVHPTSYSVGMFACFPRDKSTKCGYH